MLQGDTVRLKVYFKDFNSKAIDPQNVTLSIFKSNKELLEQFNLTESNKSEKGVYFYDYSPTDLTEFVYEFKGLHNDKPILVREKVKTTFI